MTSFVEVGKISVPWKIFNIEVSLTKLKLSTLYIKHFQNKFDTQTKSIFQENYLFIALKVTYIQGAEINEKAEFVLK